MEKLIRKSKAKQEEPKLDHTDSSGFGCGGGGTKRVISNSI